MIEETEPRKPENTAPDRYALLADYLRRRDAEPFEWGKNDCCLHVCNAILAMTGKDIAPEVFRKGYDALGGFRLIKAYTGGGSTGLTTNGVEQIAEQLAAKNGMVEVAPAFMRRGDPALVRDEKAGAVLGICTGASIALVGSERGLIYVSMDKAARAWRLP